MNSSASSVMDYSRDVLSEPFFEVSLTDLLLEPQTFFAVNHSTKLDYKRGMILEERQDWKDVTPIYSTADEDSAVQISHDRQC